MPSVTLTKITQPGGGRVVFTFGKISMEFQSIAAAVDYVHGMLSAEGMRAIAIALCLTRQPALSNPSLLEGHAVGVDFTLTNWGTIT